MRIEVVYAKPEEQVLEAIELPAGARLADALAHTGLFERFPEIDRDNLNVGIFGKLQPRDHPLRDGDRVEIYRTLLIDPLTARRQRALKH